MSEREPAAKPHVVILGPMGVGKTTCGIAVAKRLGRLAEVIGYLSS